MLYCADSLFVLCIVMRLSWWFITLFKGWHVCVGWLVVGWFAFACGLGLIGFVFVGLPLLVSVVVLLFVVC